MAILHLVLRDAVHVDRPACAPFGSRRSEVQILSPRLNASSDNARGCVLLLLFIGSDTGPAPVPATHPISD